MKSVFIIAFFVMGAAIVVWLWSRFRVAQSGTLADLPQQLGRLRQQDTDPKAFFGFCTCDEDALYVVRADGVFYLDYELTTPAKKTHEEEFRQTAASLSLSVIETSYGAGAPVLRVGASNSEEQATQVASEFAQRLFGHDRNTIFEFLP